MAGLVVFVVDHPHPNPGHVMRIYRKYLIGQKRVWMAQSGRSEANRCLRGLIRYHQFVQTYLQCKRLYLSEPL